MSGALDSLSAAVVDGGKAFGFLLLLALAARFGTKIIGKLMSTKDDELLVISFLGVAVFVAGVSEMFGVADAIGAFMVGLMLGSTSSGDRILRLVQARCGRRVRRRDRPSRRARQSTLGDARVLGAVAGGRVFDRSP
ncbi:hypothetical protein SCALM49S_05662 [Streptomyces californicus]